MRVVVFNVQILSHVSFCGKFTDPDLAMWVAVANLRLERNHVSCCGQFTESLYLESSQKGNLRRNHFSVVLQDISLPSGENIGCNNCDVCAKGKKVSAGQEGLCDDLSDVCNHPGESQTTCFHHAVKQCYLQVRLVLPFTTTNPPPLDPSAWLSRRHIEEWS